MQPGTPQKTAVAILNRGGSSTVDRCEKLALKRLPSTHSAVLHAQGPTLRSRPSPSFARLDQVVSLQNFANVLAAEIPPSGIAPAKTLAACVVPMPVRPARVTTNSLSPCVHWGGSAAPSTLLRPSSPASAYRLTHLIRPLVRSRTDATALSSSNRLQVSHYKLHLSPRDTSFQGMRAVARPRCVSAMSPV